MKKQALKTPLENILYLMSNESDKTGTELLNLRSKVIGVVNFLEGREIALVNQNNYEVARIIAMILIMDRFWITEYESKNDRRITDFTQIEKLGLIKRPKRKSNKIWGLPVFTGKKEEFPELIKKFGEEVIIPQAPDDRRLKSQLERALELTEKTGRLHIFRKDFPDRINENLISDLIEDAEYAEGIFKRPTIMMMDFSGITIMVNKNSKPAHILRFFHLARKEEINSVVPPHPTVELLYEEKIDQTLIYRADTPEEIEAREIKAKRLAEASASNPEGYSWVVAQMLGIV